MSQQTKAILKLSFDPIYKYLFLCKFNCSTLNTLVMKPFIKLAVACCIILLAQSCGPTLSVTSDYDHGANFMQYKTFKLLQPDAQHQTISSLNQERIYAAIKANMTGKGFTEAADADLLVNAVIIIKDNKYLSANTYGNGGFYRPYAWGGGFSQTTVSVEEDKQGSLIIDVVDSKANKLLWTATGNQSIDQPLSDPATQLPVIVNKIMASFPPGMVPAK
jgi:hypothetical protein